MWQSLKNLFDRIIHFKKYSNSNKLTSIMHLGSYQEALDFIKANEFRITREVLVAWLENVFITSNGAPISKQHRVFNLEFIELIKMSGDDVLQDYLESFQFSPSIVNINKAAITFKLPNGKQNSVPYSEFNFHKLSMWLITQSTLNNLMVNYSHTIELLNTKFNDENIYPAKNKEAETFKLFLSVFHKQAMTLKSQQEEIEEIDFFKKNPQLKTFDFKGDYTELLAEHLSILNKIQVEVENWNWRVKLNTTEQAENLHRMEKIMTHQIAFCIQQYMEMPKKFRDSMKNHDNLNMNELLTSNLGDILENIQNIKASLVMQQAQSKLFNQTVQKTMLANQKSGN